jgi:hypothetical protein
MTGSANDLEVLRLTVQKDFVEQTLEGDFKSLVLSWGEDDLA